MKERIITVNKLLDMNQRSGQSAITMKELNEYTRFSRTDTGRMESNIKELTAANQQATAKLTGLWRLHSRFYEEFTLDGLQQFLSPAPVQPIRDVKEAGVLCQTVLEQMEQVPLKARLERPTSEWALLIAKEANRLPVQTGPVAVSKGKGLDLEDEF